MVNAIDFVNKLQELNYFSYADPSDIEAIKKDMIENFDPYEKFFIFQDDSSALDYRFHYCDGEDLFEQDGLLDMMKYLQPTFEKIGLRMEITEHVQQWDREKRWGNQHIVINGKKYIIFRNFSGYGWGEAAQRLSEVLNDQLTIQGKEDRVYLIAGGNDGSIIFLTPEQFKYIYSVYVNKYQMPLELAEWCRIMNQPYMHIAEDNS